MSRKVLAMLLTFAFASAAQQRNPVSVPVQISPAELKEHAQSVWQPQYPERAKAKHLEGAVKIRVVIDELGHVAKATIISGDPLLISAALPVVKRWNYAPFERGGRRISVTAVVDIPFRYPGGLSDYQEWQKHLERANALRHDDREQEAETEYKAAIATAHNLSDQDLADSLRDLAFFYYQNGRLNNALPLFEQRLQVLVSSRVQDPPEIAYARTDLAVLLARLGKFDRTEPLLRGTIPILEKYKRAASLKDTKVEYDKQISLALFGLALVLQHKGDNSEAESAFKQAIAVGKPVLAPDDAALIIRNYAGMLQQLGRTDEASALNAEATALQLDLAPQHH